jgi:3-deoxy-D-manno-oct-2-ulosonic acid (Kdo) hydroxylase
MQSKVFNLQSSITTWTHGAGDTLSAGLAAALESGDVLFFPKLAFPVHESERPLFSPAIVTTAKNISFDPRRGRVAGVAGDGSDATALRNLVSRFSSVSATFVGAVLPDYRGRIEIGRTSFRPIEIAGRASSWRKDDTRLHIDSFPATPVHGRRILRVFSNVNPQGKARVWRIGDHFENVARQFAGRLRIPWPGSGALLRLLRLTKARRSAYDALMLQLHDRMKADTEFQAAAPQTRFEFPPGSTWMAFTDQVSHAAMAGQFQLEQTFLLPIDAMLDPQRSPLRILERLVGRRLV